MKICKRNILYYYYYNSQGRDRSLCECGFVLRNLHFVLLYKYYVNLRGNIMKYLVLCLYYI